MVYDKNGKAIKSDYDYWHLKPQQVKFNSEFNSWFSHFQMNDDKLPGYKEGNDWVDANKGKPWMEELCKEYNIAPVGPRECAAFYMALKSIGEINEQGQPVNNSRQITSSNDESVSDEWKDIYHTLTEFWEKMGDVMWNCVDDINAKRFAQDCYDGIETWIQNCKRKGHIEINDRKFVHNSRQITSSFNYYDGFEDDVAFFAENYEGNDESDLVEWVAGKIEDNDHPTESPEEFDSLMRAVHEELKRQGYFKQPWQVNSSKEITSNKEPADMDMAYQLEGYIESDGQLYTQMIVPVIKNLERKVKKGIYDYDKSLIIWERVADEGAKRYVKEQGGPAYNVATRKEVAKKLSEYYEENYMGDNPIESSNKRDSIRREQEEIMRKDMDYFKKHGKPRPHRNNPDYTYVSCDENGDVVESSLNKNDKKFIKGLITDSSMEDPNEKIENYTYECEELGELPEGTSREEFFNELLDYFNELDGNENNDEYVDWSKVGRIHSDTAAKTHPKLWKITYSRAESCIEILEEILKHIEKENPGFSGNLSLNGDICYLSFSQNGSEKWIFYISIGDCRYTVSGKLIPDSYSDSILRVVKPEIKGYIDFNDFNKLPDMIYTIMDTNPKELNEIK